jgi:hypothetical protein
MDGSRVTKKTFEKWLEEAATQSDDAFQSVHVDELEGLGLFDVDGLELVRQCCALLQNGRTILRNVQAARSFRYLVMFLPIPPIKTLCLWDEELWERVTGSDEPPTLYLMAHDQLLEEWDEEYHRPVQVPVAEHSGFRALYRCWRTRYDMQKSWEFARGVYVVVDFRQAPLSDG